MNTSDMSSAMLKGISMPSLTRFLRGGLESSKATNSPEYTLEIVFIVYEWRRVSEMLGKEARFSAWVSLVR